MGGPMLRPARVQDLRTICTLEQQQFPGLSWSYVTLRQLFDLHGSHWVVADVDGGVRGYALVGIGGAQRGWVLGLAVDSEYRGRGIARALLEQAVTNCRAALVDSVYITVRPTNQAATNLYKKAGFTRISHETQYFGAEEPRDVLVRRITHGPRTIADPDDQRWIKRLRDPGW
ncbi:GNAT family N-acetyltransferase [Nocardia sp. NPDC050710]|uniref:GNAT family N-acetyltransferase n=1 Tax=Nocardia sp. NPDC050710 TaxID=3157220 RepID=UPI0033CAAFA7